MCPTFDSVESSVRRHSFYDLLVATLPAFSYDKHLFESGGSNKKEEAEIALFSLTTRNFQEKYRRTLQSFFSPACQAILNRNKSAEFNFENIASNNKCTL